MAWTGFTDEQLMQLKNQSGEEANHPRSNHPRRPPQHARRGAPKRVQSSRNTAQRGPRLAANTSQTAETLNPNQMLSKPKEIPNRTRSQQRPRLSSSSDEDLAQRRGNSKGMSVRNEYQKANKMGDSAASQKGKGSLGQNDKNTGGNQQQEEVEVENKEVLTEELDEKEGLSRELTKLEKFQEEQTKMEEENARRKALLSRAIADRKKKTQAEAKRLTYIQKELAKIEDLLTNDVRILRDRIEEASRTYLEAQKRYQKAEEEFVAAKMYLHKMDDMKESLTEHLCTIIHENELRKAKKLEELVNKLEVENLDDFETQLSDEGKTPPSPTTKLVEKPTVDVQADANKSAQNGTSVVVATNQAASEKTSPETSGMSTGDLQDSSKTLESQAPEGTVNQTVEGAVHVQSNKGAKQESASITSKTEMSEAGKNQDLNPSADQKGEGNEETASDLTVPCTSMS